MKLALLLAICGCLDTAPETDTIDQAVNGETWANAGILNATSNTPVHLAASPITHTIIAAVEGDGVEAWTSKPGQSFYLTHTFASEVSAGIAADQLGNFYVLGQGNGEWSVYRSGNDGASWSRIHQQPTGMYDEVFGISVDSGGYVWVTGFQGLTGGNRQAVVWRGAARGTLWTNVMTTTAPGGQAWANVSCEGLYNGQLANFIVGATGSSTSMGGTVYVTTDHGASWTTAALPWPAHKYFEITGCAVTQDGNLATTARADDVGSATFDAKLWDVSANRLIFDGSFSQSGSVIARGVAVTPKYVYFTGNIGIIWYTERMSLADGTVTTVDIFAYPNSDWQYGAGAVFDTSRGLFVAGDTGAGLDANNRTVVVRRRQ